MSAVLDRCSSPPYRRPPHAAGTGRPPRAAGANRSQCPGKFSVRHLQPLQITTMATGDHEAMRRHHLEAKLVEVGALKGVVDQLVIAGSVIAAKPAR